MADECPKCEEGLPPWLATFADLMALLMCFFVLLLSFAEIDAIRFKKMAESMKDAFGVQREIPANEIVKGTSVIMEHFSSGKPESTPIEEIRQQTIEVEKEFLDVEAGSEKTDNMDIDAAKAAVQAQLEQEVEQQATELLEMLQAENMDAERARPAKPRCGRPTWTSSPWSTSAIPCNGVSTWNDRRYSTPWAPTARRRAAFATTNGTTSSTDT